MMKQQRQRSWRIEDLPWNEFNPAAVDPKLVPIIKAAALVEYNAGDYAAHLRSVFAGDAMFEKAIAAWSQEETQHGAALGRWAEMADPSFNFQRAFARFTQGYQIPAPEGVSARGSRTGELVARCIVETGTSGYYTALSDAAEEPVLKALCRLIAADEIRHYTFFRTTLKRYEADEGLSSFARLRIGLGRVNESEDDELAYAYFAANAPPDAVYKREDNTAAYMQRAYPLYRPDHIARMLTMVAQACGFTLPTVLRSLLQYAAGALLRVKGWLARRRHLYVTLIKQA